MIRHLPAVRRVVFAGIVALAMPALAQGGAVLTATEPTWIIVGGGQAEGPAAADRIGVAGQAVAPRVADPPRVTGTPSVFSKLVASTGTWVASEGEAAPPELRFDFQWQRCPTRGSRCVDIPGATAMEYVVWPADVGWRLRIHVKASNPAGSGIARSALTRMVSGTLTVQLPLTESSADGGVSRIFTANGKPTASAVQTRQREVLVARTKVVGGTLVSVGLLRFDTSSIPPAARITTVRLQFPVIASASEDRLRLVVESYPGSRWPIGRADFAVSPRRKPLADYEPNWLRAGQLGDIPLLATAIVPGTPTSAFRLLLPGGPARARNVLRFAAVDHRTLAAPTLLVTYDAR